MINIIFFIYIFILYGDEAIMIYFYNVVFDKS
jgi:hypothetical protein